MSKCHVTVREQHSTKSTEQVMEQHGTTCAQK